MKSPTSKSKIFFIISAVLIAVSIISLCVQGLNLGIDFTGGSTFSINLNKTEYSKDVEEAISKIVKENADTKDVQVQKVDKSEVSIKTIELTNEQSEAITEAIKKEFKLEQKHISRIEKVSGSVSGRLIADSLKAIALAIILMLLYITWRFDFRSGSSAVLALAHDVIIMLGFYSLLRLSVSTSFIAAILTIVGYFYQCHNYCI